MVNDDLVLFSEPCLLVTIQRPKKGRCDTKITQGADYKNRQRGMWIIIGRATKTLASCTYNWVSVNGTRLSIRHQYIITRVIAGIEPGHCQD